MQVNSMSMVILMLIEYLSYSFVCRKINKLPQFSSTDKSSIWQVLMCVSFPKCKDGSTAIIKLKFANPQKKNRKQVKCQVINLPQFQNWWVLF